MAIFNGKNIKGTIGPISLTPRGNETIIRSKPGRGGVKQTAATKKSAALFGTVISPFAKLLRQAAAPLHLGFYDGAMVNRMNSAVATIFNQHLTDEGNFSLNEESFKRLNGFDFNSQSPLNKSLLITPRVNLAGEELSMNLSPFEVSKNLKFPHTAQNCVIQFQLALFNLDQNKWKLEAPKELSIAKSQKNSEGISLSYTIPEGTLVLLVCAIRYFKNNLMMDHKSFHPAGIIEALYRTGKPSSETLTDWIAMPLQLELANHEA